MLLQNGKLEGTIGSDLERDGMYLEVTEINNPVNAVLEIFYSDVSNKLSITLFKENVELELLEEAIEIAKKRLIPIK